MIFLVDFFSLVRLLGPQLSLPVVKHNGLLEPDFSDRGISISASERPFLDPHFATAVILEPFPTQLF